MTEQPILFAGKSYTGKQLIKLRESKNLTPAQFWGMVGTAEAAGLFYEGGTKIPPLTSVAVELVHELGCDIGSPYGRLTLHKQMHQQQAIQALGELET